MPSARLRGFTQQATTIRTRRIPEDVRVSATDEVQRLQEEAGRAREVATKARHGEARWKARSDVQTSAKIFLELEATKSTLHEREEQLAKVAIETERKMKLADEAREEKRERERQAVAEENAARFAEQVFHIDLCGF